MSLDRGRAVDPGHLGREPEAFDAHTYDRLSVLLTELRRILRDGRDVRVETATRTYTRDDLAAALAEF